MGSLVGWIVQKRWLTLSAFALLVLGMFVFPGLPSPLSYLAFITPALLLAAIIYEVSGLLPLRVSRRLRVAWAIWMGLCVAELMTAVVIGGSNETILFTGIGLFVLLVMPSIFVVQRAYVRAKRREEITKANSRPG